MFGKRKKEWPFDVDTTKTTRGDRPWEAPSIGQRIRGFFLSNTFIFSFATIAMIVGLGAIFVNPVSEEHHSDDYLPETTEVQPSTTDLPNPSDIATVIIDPSSTYSPDKVEHTADCPEGCIVATVEYVDASGKPLAAPIFVHGLTACDTYEFTAKNIVGYFAKHRVISGIVSVSDFIVSFEYGPLPTTAGKKDPTRDSAQQSSITAGGQNLDDGAGPSQQKALIGPDLEATPGSDNSLADPQDQPSGTVSENSRPNNPGNDSPDNDKRSTEGGANW